MSKEMSVQINANVMWQATYDPEAGSWIGVCPDLNLNAVGDSYGQLLECAVDAMQLLFEDLLAEHELEAFRRRHGWALAEEVGAEQEQVRFDVPFSVERVTPQAMALA